MIEFSDTAGYGDGLVEVVVDRLTVEILVEQEGVGVFAFAVNVRSAY